ncbi:ABC transporter substrate binding protein [candidate division KSB1 bacterium]
MKNILCIVLILITSTGVLTAVGQNTNQDKTVRIGIVVDGPFVLYEEPVVSLFKNEITDLLKQEYDVQFPTEKYVRGEWTVESVESALDRLLIDEEVDIIITMGLMASANAAQRSELPKPVVAPWIVDAELQDAPYENGKSGVHNLCYINKPVKSLTDMKIFHEVYPFKNPVYMLDKVMMDVSPGLVDYMRNLAEEMGINMNFAIIDTDVDQALNSIPADADAVIYGPLFRQPLEDYKRLIDVVNDRGLPSFAAFLRNDVENGVFAGFISENFFLLRARRTASNIQRIVSGEDPSSIPVAISENSHLVINMETARKIKIYPSWDIFNEAELIKDVGAKAERVLTLSSAVAEAVQVNLDIAAKKHYVAAGEQNINEARSNLLPSIELSGLQTVIDKDRAEKSFGQQAERMLIGTATATQVIFSEKAWTNYSVQKNLQVSRKEEYNQFKLDIIRDAATAYLNLLKIKTIEDIQKKNLILTRNNHEIAQIRRSIGVSGPSEIYRWESEIASSRKSVIEANAVRNTAEIALNRLLHRPLEEPFRPEETSLNDALLFTSDKRYFDYTRDKGNFRLLRDFFVKTGFESSPELRALDAVISAKARALSSAKRAYWSPTIAVQGSADNVFNRAGDGSGSVNAQLPAEMAGIFSKPKDFSWNVGLNVSFPLFEGGNKRAVQLKAHEELRRLEIEKEAVQEQIEHGIRSYMHIAGASYWAIALSESAAEAADKNLNLVQDAYTKGMVSIIELIDAQKASLNAGLAAANASYTFIIDLLNVQRAVGKLDVTATQEEREELFKKAEEYFAEKQIQ